MENSNEKPATKQIGLGESFTKSTPESSSVRSISYDAATKIFSITFKSNGSVYDYAGVRPKDALNALNSKSYGTLARLELSHYKGVKRGDMDF